MAGPLRSSCLRLFCQPRSRHWSSRRCAGACRRRTRARAWQSYRPGRDSRGVRLPQPRRGSSRCAPRYLSHAGQCCPDANVWVFRGFADGTASTTGTCCPAGEARGHPRTGLMYCCHGVAALSSKGGCCTTAHPLAPLGYADGRDSAVGACCSFVSHADPNYCCDGVALPAANGRCCPAGQAWVPAGVPDVGVATCCPSDRVFTSSRDNRQYCCRDDLWNNHIHCVPRTHPISWNPRNHIDESRVIRANGGTTEMVCTRFHSPENVAGRAANSGNKCHYELFGKEESSLYYASPHIARFQDPARVRFISRLVEGQFFGNGWRRVLVDGDGGVAVNICRFQPFAVSSGLYDYWLLGKRIAHTYNSLGCIGAWGNQMLADHWGGGGTLRIHDVLMFLD